MTLYERISPFLRTESPKTAAEAEGKTDFICDALRKALKLGAITDGEYKQVLSRVKSYLQSHNLDPESGTVNEVAANNGWWMYLSKENRHREMQSYRHILLDYWCDLIEGRGHQTCEGRWEMKIAKMSEEKLNYLVAKSLNWQWRYTCLLAKEGYVSWRGTEDAWGAWHPDYCSSWAAIGPIMTTCGIFPEVSNVSQDDDGFVTFDGGFLAKTPDQVLDGVHDGEWGSTPQIAVVRAYLVKTYGKEVDMPELEMIP